MLLEGFLDGIGGLALAFEVGGVVLLWEVMVILGCSGFKDM